MDSEDVIRQMGSAAALVDCTDRAARAILPCQPRLQAWRGHGPTAFTPELKPQLLPCVSNTNSLQGTAQDAYYLGKSCLPAGRATLDHAIGADMKTRTPDG